MALSAEESVSAILASLADKPNVTGNHPLRQYISAFDGFLTPAKRLIGTGGDFVVIELADGNVLKISSRLIVAPLGDRPFDMPSIDKGTRLSASNLPISYVVQPMAEVPVSPETMRQFRQILAEQGYGLIDGGRDQVGLYEGEPKLLDLFAVRRVPD